MKASAMRRDEEQRRAVILSGGGWPGAYDIVRALGRAGVKSIVVSSQPDDIAFHSRYVDGRINLPEFQPCHYEKIGDALEAIGTSEGGRPVLFYVGDAEVPFVHQFRPHKKALASPPRRFRSLPARLR